MASAPASQTLSRGIRILEILADGIEDTAGAQTRFVLVTREGRIPARTGADKTTVVIQLPHNRSGALLEALEMLSANGVGTRKLERFGREFLALIRAHVDGDDEE